MSSNVLVVALSAGVPFAALTALGIAVAFKPDAAPGVTQVIRAFAEIFRRKD